MKIRAFLPALVAAIGLAAPSITSAGQTLYAIGDGGASLLQFDSSSPGTISRVGSFDGAATFLDGINFRPATGQLYGYLDSTDSLYTVNLTTAALTLASTLNVPTNTFELGINFNPQVDRLRIVTDSQQNLRVNVATGATTNDGPLTYAVGDVNENSLATLVVAAAYTNKVANAASTSLYYIDYNLDVLATTTDPNAGILNTVGSLGVDTNEFVGFDIATNGGLNTAYALLTVQNTTSLYTINLSTGAASSLGALGTGFGNIYGLAAAPALATAVPEPSSLIACGFGVMTLAAGAFRSRSRKNSR